jgi:copper resistance protein D
MTPDAALVVCRFLNDASAMLLWGTCAYLATLMPKDLALEIGRRLQLFSFVTAAVAVATTAVTLPLGAAAIGDGWRDAVDPATVRAVLFETGVGEAWQARATAALLLTISLASPFPGFRATALSAGLLLASLAATGHAAMHEGWLGLAHRVNDAAHVLSGGAWLGALVPLLLVLRADDDIRHKTDAALALRRFSTAGHIAVALVVATGVVNTVLVLGRWPTDWSSPYQAMLATKIVVVLAMVALAAVNRYLLVPQIACGRLGAVRAIRFGAVAEIALGLSAIGLVAVFGMLEPT